MHFVSDGSLLLVVSLLFSLLFLAIVLLDSCELFCILLFESILAIHSFLAQCLNSRSTQSPFFFFFIFLFGQDLIQFHNYVHSCFPMIIGMGQLINKNITCVKQYLIIYEIATKFYPFSFFGLMFGGQFSCFILAFPSYPVQKPQRNGQHKISFL